jgi:hypothetical protein
MNTDVEELLTEQLRKQAESTAWRPELLDGALRRHKARRTRGRLLFPGLAVGVAGAVVLSVASVAVPGRSVRTAVHPKAQTVAYVVSRAQSAMAAADADVLRIQTHMPDGWMYTLWFEVRPVLQLRIDVQSPSGPLQDTFADGSRVLTVDFRNRIWWTVQRPRSSGSQVTLMLPGEAMVPLLSAGTGFGGLWLPTPQNLRHELADGAFRLAGRQASNGARLLHLQGTGASDRGVNIWVNAASYLPVRSSMLVRVQTGRRLGWMLLSSRLTWLSATRPNLVVLTPRIPAGFKHQEPQCPCG